MFKRGAGLVVSLAVAVAAMRYAGPSAAPAGGGSGGNPPGSATATLTPKPYAGGCTAYDTAANPTPGKPYDENSGAAKKKLDEFFGLDTVKDKKELSSGVRYAIALVPDPVHTHLSLMFDREISVVQQAAQDEGYIYNSSWLPWSNRGEDSLAYLADRQYLSDLTDGREACPGVILFRRNLEPAKGVPAGEAYREGLVVFVVGEQPTGGIDEDQWSNARQWLQNNARAGEDGKVADGVLRILGPTFTGSLSSLERILAETYAKPSTKPPSRPIATMFPEARVLSGSVTGCSEIQWFEHRTEDVPELNGRVRFGTFQENDALHIFRFLEYLKSQGTNPRDTAILSEDETAYAAALTRPRLAKTAKNPAKTDREPVREPDPCVFEYAEEDRPVHLVYPRDISALRNAYQKQSIFKDSEESKRTSRAILKDEADDKASEEATDTVPVYSKSVSALAQEAYMFGVVSFLRTHHTRYLVLRCTNPLDFLFLARFFHREYPEARIVTVGSDLLFRREIDTTEFRGLLSLSSYPLIPRGQHWTQITEEAWQVNAHNHLIFEDHVAEGSYIASRYLFKNWKPDERKPAPLEPCTDSEKQSAGSGKSVACRSRDEYMPPIHLPRAFAAPDYGDPFWLHNEQCPVLPTHPPTWLAAVGRDGYWPLAVLREVDPRVALTSCDQGKVHDWDLRFPVEELASPPADEKARPKSTMVELDGQWTHDHQPGDQHYQLAMDAQNQIRYAEPPHYGMWLRMRFPTAWVCCLLLAILLAVYQLWGMTQGSGKAYRIFSIFRGMEGWPAEDRLHQELLFGANCALALMPLIELTGFGFFPIYWGGSHDSPLRKEIAVGLLQLSVVLLAAMAFFVWKWYKARTLLVFAGSLTGLTLLYFIAFLWNWNDANLIPLVYRMAHLTDGASPLLPMLLLTLGFYLWNWNAVAGNLMLAQGSPTLPKLQTDAAAPNRLRTAQSRISQTVADKIIEVAKPLKFTSGIVALPGFLLLSFLVCFLIPWNLPLLSLEGRAFNFVLNGLLLAGFAITAAEALRIYYTWLNLQRLLQALARLRLRRTLARLRPIDANSLWSVSGNVPRVQYRLFDRQLGAAGRLMQITSSLADYLNRFVYLKLTLDYGKAFRESVEGQTGRGIPWDEECAPVGAQNTLGPKYVREVFADGVAEVINNVLLPEWDEETNSLNFERTPGEGEEATGGSQLALSEKPRIRAAEEFVCFHYIAFIQNIVARMRTMTLSMISLFVSVCFAISFYPFVPRTEITVWMILNLGLIGFAVAYVYAGMERDEIMSYMTNSKPGQLGVEFWVKLAGFLAAPVIGILTTQFPSIADSVLGWLQPGLDAVK